MSDLDITIELDPGHAATGAKKVVDEFKRAEDQGKAAEAAYTSLQSTFKRLANVIMEEMRRTNAALSGLGDTFRRIADHERAMQAIANQRVENLGEALARVAQYQALIDKQAAEAQRTAMSVVSLPAPQASAGMLDKSKDFIGRVAGASSAGGFLGGLVGGVAGGNVLGLLSSGLSSLIDQWGEHDRAVAAAEKSLRSQFATMEQTERAVAQLDASAARLNLSLEDQSKALESVHSIAERFYLTTRDQVQATEALAAAALRAGRSIETVSTFMDGLEKAAADGAVNLNELRGLIRQFPEAVDRWAQALGISNAELELMARKGLLGEEALDAYFAVLRDGDPVMKEGIKNLQQSSNWLEQQAGTALAAGAAAKTWADLWEEATNRVRKDADQAQRDFNRSISGAYDLLDDAAARAWDSANRLFNGDGWTDSGIERGLKAIGAGVRGVRSEVDKLQQSIIAVDWVTISNLARSADLAAVDTISGGTDVGTFRSATGSGGIRQATDVPVPQVPSAIDWERLAAANRDAQDALTEYNRSLKTTGDEMEELFAGQLIGSAREFASILVDAASGADVSWKEFGLNTLRTFEKMIAQALILQAVTGSVTGQAGPGGGYGGLLGALGFATGGSALVTETSLRRLPAAATGMDAIVGGAGGTDSRIAALRVTPGERIIVQTPAQQREAGRPSGGSTINNNISVDPRALLALNNTPEGRRSIVNAIVVDAAVIRRALGIA